MQNHIKNISSCQECKKSENDNDHHKKYMCHKCGNEYDTKDEIKQHYKMHLVKHRPKIRGRFVIKSVATIQQEKLNI